MQGAVSKTAGVVLVTNLIMMLIITLIATALFKNSYLQTKMVNHHLLQQLASQKTEQALIEARDHITTLLTDASDLSLPSQGIYPYRHELSFTNFDWSNNSELLQASNKSKYFIVYLGKHQPVADMTVSKHLFKVIAYSELSKGSSYFKQQLMTFALID